MFSEIAENSWVMQQVTRAISATSLKQKWFQSLTLQQNLLLLFDNMNGKFYFKKGQNNLGNLRTNQF